MGYLKVRDIGKAYKRYPGKWARLAEWITGREWHEKYWVLRDISFDISAGESIGVLGVNGAGKSTLLKIITGTTQASTGNIEIGGRIAALLELGLGFHPDFTGRQNAYMSGLLFGLSGPEITQLMPDIESFAGIGDYIDQPLRTYSSGMQVRLAFALATARPPDILIVDEALSVGDAAFQRKCFRRIETFREKGCTLLLVSHSIDTVLRLCSKAIFLMDGVIKSFGDAKSVCDDYERYLFEGYDKIDSGQSQINHSILNRIDQDLLCNILEVNYGNKDAIIEKCWLEDELGNEVNILYEEEVFYWKYQVKFIKECHDVTFGMMIKTKEGICLYAFHTALSGLYYSFKEEENILVSFRLVNNLSPGTYYLNAGIEGLVNNEKVILHRRVDTKIFKINFRESKSLFNGMVNMKGKIEIHRLQCVS